MDFQNNSPACQNLRQKDIATEALDGLLFSYQQDGKNFSLAMSIVATALSSIGVKKPGTEDEESRLLYRAKAEHLAGYIEKWLVYSIKLELPATWVDQIALKPQEELAALEFIRDKLLENEKTVAQIPSEQARALISRHLNKLIDKINISKIAEFYSDLDDAKIIRNLAESKAEESAKKMMRLQQEQLERERNQELEKEHSRLICSESLAEREARIDKMAQEDADEGWKIYQKNKDNPDFQ